ncbi:MAG: tyrosine-type recombinase/integrase [Holosporaceae bacterium]|jgi:integrase/recombinase XerC|nr:tyrosine-type recombinase/integrase [Holosporaceae bacterium]
MAEKNSNLNNLVDEWLQELIVQRRYSAHTVGAYGRDLANFLSFLGDHFGETASLEILGQMKISDFRSWFSRRIGNGLCPRSNVRALSSVRSFFSYLAKGDLIELNVINGVKRPKLPSLLPKPVNEKTILNFLNSASFFDSDPEWVTDRDRALYTLLYCTGIRIGEALSIKTNDVASEIKIVGKGKKDRVIILLSTALARLEKYMASCPHTLSGGYLFLGVRGKKLHHTYVDNRLQKLRLIHGLPEHTSAHAFRHSFATHLVQNGADLRSVQELLGHESLASTQIYTDVDDYNLLKIYEKSHPLETRR